MHLFALAHRHQVLALVAFFGVCHVFGCFFAVHRHPAGLDQHLAFGFERMPRRTRGAGGHHELGAGEKHRQKTPHHQVVQLLLGVAQTAGRLQRGNDGEVVGHLAVVKHPLARADVAVVERGERMRRQMLHAGIRQHLEGLLHRGQIVFGQRTRIGARVGECLVALVQALRQLQRGFG